MLPLLTADLPGIDGEIKRQPDDFVVEEVPAYLPSGEGEFVYLWIEKRGLSSEQMVSHLARELHVAHQEIGVAGMKDRHAVTRQWVSVPARCESGLATFRHDGIRILEAARHRNKLRTGHLRGNRFSILVRDPLGYSLPPSAGEGSGMGGSGEFDFQFRKSDFVKSSCVTLASAIAERLGKHGFPNYFGDQRFGRDNETLDLGLALLRGTKTPGAIPRARRKFLLRLALSAVQSHLFNLALAARLSEGTLQRVLPGDVLQVVASGGPFVSEDPASEQQRLDAREIVVSGPLFGPKMKAPQGVVAEREAALLRAADLSSEMFARFANLTSGTRRPYVVWLDDLALAAEPEGLRLAFTLPSGSYATVVLREFLKVEAQAASSPGTDAV